MAQALSVTSTDYPYLRIRFTIRGQQSDEVLALLDTGFTGHLVIPPTTFSGAPGLPDTRIDWQLGDGSVVDSPLDLGTVEIIGFPPLPAAIAILGNEHVLGLGILDRFRVTFDHGQQVIVEP
jgi:predicted aspartyl protease